MFDLNEIEMRTLATLEEAGEENFTCLINTVALNAPISEIKRDFLDALRGLVQRNQVRLSTSRGLDRRLVDLSIEASLVEIDGQDARLEFDSVRDLWTDSTRSGPPYPSPNPYVVLTPAGLARSREILTERGYQWWSPIA